VPDSVSVENNEKKLSDDIISSQDDIYLVGFMIYKLIMSKTQFNVSSLPLFENISEKGEEKYEKILKNYEGGFYSEEFVDLIHSMIDFVFFSFVCLFIGCNILLMLFRIQTNALQQKQYWKCQYSNR
jgi:serine/threonine protein kinase